MFWAFAEAIHDKATITWNEAKEKIGRRGVFIGGQLRKMRGAFGEGWRGGWDAWKKIY
jgi:hypothetical protein